MIVNWSNIANKPWYSCTYIYIYLNTWQVLIFRVCIYQYMSPWKAWQETSQISKSIKLIKSHLVSDCSFSLSNPSMSRPIEEAEDYFCLHHSAFQQKVNGREGGYDENDGKKPCSGSSKLILACLVQHFFIVQGFRKTAVTFVTLKGKKWCFFCIK